MAQLQDPGFPELPSLTPIMQGLKDARISANARMEMEAHLETRKAVEANKRAIIAQTQGASILFNQAMTPAQSGANRAVLGFTAMALVPGVAESGLSSPAALSNVLAQGMLQPGMPQQVRSIVGNMNESIAMPDAEISNWFDMHSRGEMRSVSMSQLMHMAKTDGKYGELARKYLSTELTPEAKAAAAQLFTSPLMGSGEMVAFDDAGNVIGGQQLREYRALQQFAIEQGMTPDQAQRSLLQRREATTMDQDATQRRLTSHANMDPWARSFFGTGVVRRGADGQPTGEAWTLPENAQALITRVDQILPARDVTDAERVQVATNLHELTPSEMAHIKTPQDAAAAAAFVGQVGRANPMLRHEIFARAGKEGFSWGNAMDHSAGYTEALATGNGGAYLRAMDQFLDSPTATRSASRLVSTGMVAEENIKHLTRASLETFSTGIGQAALAALQATPDRTSGTTVIPGRAAVSGDVNKAQEMLLTHLNFPENTSASVRAIQTQSFLQAYEEIINDRVITPAELDRLAALRDESVEAAWGDEAIRASDFLFRDLPQIRQAPGKLELIQTGESAEQVERVIRKGALTEDEFSGGGPRTQTTQTNTQDSGQSAKMTREVQVTGNFEDDVSAFRTEFRSRLQYSPELATVRAQLGQAALNDPVRFSRMIRNLLSQAPNAAQREVMRSEFDELQRNINVVKDAHVGVHTEQEKFLTKIGGQGTFEAQTFSNGDTIAPYRDQLIRVTNNKTGRTDIINRTDLLGSLGDTQGVENARRAVEGMLPDSYMRRALPPGAEPNRAELHTLFPSLRDEIRTLPDAMASLAESLVEVSPDLARRVIFSTRPGGDPRSALLGLNEAVERLESMGDNAAAEVQGEGKAFFLGDLLKDPNSLEYQILNSLAPVQGVPWIPSPAGQHGFRSFMAGRAHYRTVEAAFQDTPVAFIGFQAKETPGVRRGDPAPAVDRRLLIRDPVEYNLRVRQWRHHINSALELYPPPESN